ncbi:Threonine--tRNA ligase [compost metagenome]
MDIRNEKLGYKIREAQLEKVPYMLVLGENEKNSEGVSVRKRGEGDLGLLPIQKLIEQIREEIAVKK